MHLLNHRRWLTSIVLGVTLVVIFVAAAIAVDANVLLQAISQFRSAQPAQSLPAIEDQLLDAQLRAIIAEQGLTGDPSAGRTLPQISDPAAQLGKKLFFTKALSGEMDVACASCHLPTLGGGDGLALPIGVGADDPNLIGPGRTHPSGGPTVPRNSPTTFNIGLWDQVLFFDGRVQSMGGTAGAHGGDGKGIRTPDSAFGKADSKADANLTMAQGRFPVTSAEEMRGFDFEQGSTNDAIRYHLASRLGDYGKGRGELDGNSWVEEFEAAFGGGRTRHLVTQEYIAMAIADYQRSQVFVDTSWKAYVEGDSAKLDTSAKRGAILFFRNAEQGGGSCASCHVGDFFTDEQFYALAVPQIGPGKDNGEFGDDDFGRYRETGEKADLYAFRTPTLLNIEVTAPYGHSGAYATLDGIVRHHLNPAAALANYDLSQLDPSVQTKNWAVNSAKALAQLEALRASGYSPLVDIDLSNRDVDDLVAFLGSLTDPCVKDAACLQPWMPLPDDVDPDGERLEAYTLP